ncbi:radical SAM protein [Nonomuraea sp. MG754425]|uniref:B12-binding domain-containing radical SAM protein n=1 Tax=Nonomuraea sp. MG754425 TaxID=2570319 RepID=UPI001F21BF0F|nr:radical SAM protein [Nonomuraea sp. MG754425]MCF6471652.1 radical SAM protein [Nonomuraea sp. MG754425]
MTPDDSTGTDIMLERRKLVLLSTIAVVDRNDEALWTPLGILALGTALADVGFEPVLIDTQVDADWEQRLRSALRDDLVLFGVSTLTGPSIEGALDAIAIVREVRPDLPVVWGGYHASLAKEAILREGWADYVVRGVGEPAIIPLARLLAAAPAGASRPDMSDLRRVPNLTVRHEDGFVDTHTVAQNLDDLPPMDYSLIDPIRYYTPGRRNISYISSYSCPWRCSYCAEPMHTIRKWRPQGPQRVLDAVHQIRTAYRPDFIDLVDPNFSSSPPRVVQIAQLLTAAGNDQPLACNMRATDVVRLTEMTDLRVLRDAGFARVFLGLESGSQAMLNSVLKKDSQVEHARIACRKLDEAGIEQFSSFIHDFPGETDEDNEQTAELARELGELQHNKQFHHFFIPFPATDLYNQLLARSEIDPSKLRVRDWARANTYGGWQALWPGRRDFRERVLHRLEALRAEFPEKFSYPQTVPEMQPET